jgi:hypothetical protein
MWNRLGQPITGADHLWPLGVQGPGQMAPEERQDQGRERMSDPQEVL